MRSAVRALDRERDELAQRSGADDVEHPSGTLRATRPSSTTTTHPKSRTPAELCQFIVENYHEPLRRDVPPLIEAARKVERVHAGKPAVPNGLAVELEAFWDEMQRHMMKEENVLFPLLSRGAIGAQVAMPIVMQGEHDEHAIHLANIRKLTGNLQIPSHACETWQALYRGLVLMESELMHHIHLENNVLFRVG